MNTYFIVTLVSAIACFLLPAFSFNLAARSALFNRSQSLKNSVFLPVFAVLIVSAGAGYVLLDIENDFINSMSVAKATFPLIGALIIYLSGYINRLAKFLPAVVFLCALLAVALVSDDNMSFLPQHNIWINRAIMLGAWFAFSLIYRYTNSGDGMLAIQSGSIAIGVVLLWIIGALPDYLGFLGIITAASFTALLIFSWHPSRIKISNHAATAFGFLIFGLISFATYEGAAPCMLIFCAFIFVDVIWAICYKFTFIQKYKNIMNNLAYRQALGEGMNPVQAASFSVRIQIVLLFFGAFQAYSPNPLSLLILSYVLTVWLCYRFRTIPAPAKSLKDINLQVIEDLQGRVKEIKDIVGKDK